MKSEYENKLNNLQFENWSLKAKLEEQYLFNKTISTLFTLESRKLDFLTQQIDGYLESTNNSLKDKNVKRK